MTTFRALKIVAAVVTIVGLLLGFLERYFAPTRLITEDSPNYPDWLWFRRNKLTLRCPSVSDSVTRPTVTVITATQGITAITGAIHITALTTTVGVRITTAGTGFIVITSTIIIRIIKLAGWCEG